MTSHHLDPSPDTAVDVLTAERDPVLRIEDGDTVTVRTLSAAGTPSRRPPPGRTHRRSSTGAAGTAWSARSR